MELIGLRLNQRSAATPSVVSCILRINPTCQARQSGDSLIHVCEYHSTVTYRQQRYGVKCVIWSILLTI